MTKQSFSKTKERHGKSWTPTWRSWNAAIRRCMHPNDNKYERYGGRGITVCDRWLGDNGFINFLADMGERPAGMSIDRINNDGNYEPGNCRWATPLTQSRNSSLAKITDAQREIAYAMKRDGRAPSAIAKAIGVDNSWAWRITQHVDALVERCRNGHEMTADNSYRFVRGNGKQAICCRQCKAAGERRFSPNRKRKKCCRKKCCRHTTRTVEECALMFASANA